MVYVYSIHCSIRKLLLVLRITFDLLMPESDNEKLGLVVNVVRTLLIIIYSATTVEMTQ